MTGDIGRYFRDDEYRDDECRDDDEYYQSDVSQLARELDERTNRLVEASRRSCPSDTGTATPWVASPSGRATSADGWMAGVSQRRLQLIVPASSRRHSRRKAIFLARGCPRKFGADRTVRCRPCSASGWRPPSEPTPIRCPKGGELPALFFSVLGVTIGRSGRVGPSPPKPEIHVEQQRDVAVHRLEAGRELVGGKVGADPSLTSG